ncbi:MAG: phosphatase PAP2 family protein [Candidatus Gribaldobacteria bacterium]|nr:phosphatase PAP2 family protein [Candidatus Gribaldobacteria bacterium]
MLDDSLFFAINGLAGNYLWLDVVGIFLAKYLPYFLVASLIIFLLWNWKKYWVMVFQAGIAAFLGRFAIVEIIRMFHDRSRPFLSDQTNVLLTHSTSSAFPSGHATVFFAIGTIVYLHNKKTGIVFLIFSFLMALGRVFTGLHWPLDILGGIAVGVLSGYLVYLAYPYIYKKFQN